VVPIDSRNARHELIERKGGLGGMKTLSKVTTVKVEQSSSR